MKTKFLYIAALTLLVSFTACENETPFDTQSQDDAPLILKPYNESGSGSFTYNLANPDTPLYDSVTVTPSNYTTVNWYLDGQLVFTGLKINMTFPVGKYALVIEAVTTAGKRTERTGSVTVLPYDTDPYAAAPSWGRYLAPGSTATLDGQHLDEVTEVIVSSDLYGQNAVSSITPTPVSAAQLTFVLPADVAEGNYYLRLKNAAGKIFGSDALVVTNNPPEPPADLETVIWEGNCVLNWGDSNVFLSPEEMAQVPVGATIRLEYEIITADYHALRITNQDWSSDIVPQIDGFENQPNPFEFTYTADHKAIADGNGMLITGFGYKLTKVTYK